MKSATQIRIDGLKNEETAEVLLGVLKQTADNFLKDSNHELAQITIESGVFAAHDKEQDEKYLDYMFPNRKSQKFAIGAD